MKWLTSLSALAAGAALVAAVPVEPRDPMRIYRLKVVAPVSSTLNGRYLSIATDGSVGVFGAGDAPAGAHTTEGEESELNELNKPLASLPAQFYVSSGADADSYELHTYPVGVIDHALALNGTARLMYLTDIANPTSHTTEAPNGRRLDWKSFALGDYGQDLATVKRRAVAPAVPPPLVANSVTYAGSRGRWILVQRAATSFVAAWYDGVSIILDNYRLVDIVYELETHGGVEM